MRTETTSDAAGDLDLLTGAEATDLLAAALAPAGATLRHWTLRDVEHRPGARTTATYAVTVAWPDGERTETLGATIAADDGVSTAHAADGSADSLTVTDGDRRIQVWRFPYDPELPGLAAACLPATVAALLGSTSDDAEPLLRVVSYRPRKRAVIEVTGSDGTSYLKVVRPRAAADVDRRHRMLTAAGLPVPRSLGIVADGVVALEARPGTPLSLALAGAAGDASGPTISARELLDVLDRLPPDVADLPRRQSWSANATHYAGVVTASSPHLADRVLDLAGSIQTALAQFGPGEEPTHGDFYDAQILVSGGMITGLLDVDTVGPGRRADDLACMLAHLAVLGSGTGDVARAARSAVAAWTPRFAAAADRFELFNRTAGVMLSLATGPYRAQECNWPEATATRIAQAERWAKAAHHTRWTP